MVKANDKVSFASDEDVRYGVVVKRGDFYTSVRENDTDDVWQVENSEVVEA